MGADWHSTGWAEYQMLLAGWNAIHSTEGEGDPDLGRLRRFMSAHESVH